MIHGVERRALVPHTDQRGTLREAWRKSIQDLEVHQVLLTTSTPSALRGMHYHLVQVDLCHVTTGRAYMALVDLRSDPPTTDQFWLGPDESVLIPPGVGHGYATLEGVTMSYLLTTEVDGSDEFGFRFDDPAAAIRWPVAEPLLSTRDRDAGTLSDALLHVRAHLAAAGVGG